MNWTLARFGTAVIFGWTLCTACTLGQVGMDFNGSTASPVHLLPGDLLDFHVTGTTGAQFAALISSEPRFEATNFGILRADPLAPDAVIFFDGFDPASPTYGFATIPYDGNPFTQTFIPFAAGGGYAPSYWIQALVADPLSPYGATLTNAIELVYDTPPPVISSIEPNFAAPLTQIHVVGTDFDPDPAQDVVLLNGVQCQVITATSTDLLVMLPADARSGPMTVQTPHGTSPGNTDTIAPWLAIAPAAFAVATQMPEGPVSGPLSVLGTLGAYQMVDFVVHLEANDELVAEMYAYDVSKSRITGLVTAVTPYFNPFLRVRRNPLAPFTVLTDDDSGPAFSAAIGLISGSPHYVAPFAEDVVVQVDSHNNQSGGPYLLLLSTRPAIGLPVAVQGLFPADARVGDTVTITGSGFDPGSPDQHTVLLNGATVAADLVTIGSVQFIVPPGARSGPVVVSAPAGTTSFNTDRMESWLCVHAFTEFVESEDLALPVPVGCAIRGAITAGFDTDDYLVDLAAGQTLSIECHALDPVSGSVTSSSLLAASPLDPEIRIWTTIGPPGVLAMDQNSGPGFNAGLGLYPGNPPFTAPYTGTFKIRVAAFFTLSHGPYLLVVNPGP